MIEESMQIATEGFMQMNRKIKKKKWLELPCIEARTR